MKGNNFIDVDHQVTITPNDATLNLTGQRHGGTLNNVAITGGTAAATDVNTTAGATVNGTASVARNDITAAAVDEYKGTTTFTIQCAEKPATYVTYVLTGAYAPTGTTLSANAMKATATQAVNYTYDGKTYTAYNGYIGSTAYANWADAQAFVQKLNTASYDGHSDWKLLASEEEAKAWQAQSATGFDGVTKLWSSSAADENFVFNRDCTKSKWTDIHKIFQTITALCFVRSRVTKRLQWTNEV